MRSLTLIPLLTSCIISPLCASQPFPNTQVTDGQLLARDFNRGGHSHVQKRANKLHNHAGKRQIRVHNYANEAVPFIPRKACEERYRREWPAFQRITHELFLARPSAAASQNALWKSSALCCWLAK